MNNLPDNEVPKYRKKRGKSKTQRSDHKHEYEQVIIDTKLPRVGTICKICGRLHAHFCTRPYEKGGYIMCTSLDEVKSLYPNARVLRPDEISESERKKNFIEEN